MSDHRIETVGIGRAATQPGSQGSAPQPPAASSPVGADPSRGALHIRNGRAERRPQTYGEGITWCGKKLLGQPDCSVDRVETFTSYGSEIHVTTIDPGAATCQRCHDAFDAAYNAAFPEGPKPIATIKIGDPRAKELLSPATMARFFGPGGEGVDGYSRFIASIGSSDSDRSGEADKTHSGLAAGESADPKGIAQPLSTPSNGEPA